MSSESPYFSGNYATLNFVQIYGDHPLYSGLDRQKTLPSSVGRGPYQADGGLPQTMACHVRRKEGTLRPTKGFVGPTQSSRTPT